MTASAEKRTQSPVNRDSSVIPYEGYDIPELAKVLRTLGYNLVYKPETETTMDDAMECGLTPTVVLTDHQVKGRGRGRGKTVKSWLDVKGNSILMTVAEPFCEIEADPEVKSKFPQQLFALTVCLALQEVTDNFHIQIKWPNDLVDAGTGRKLGGVLLENPDYISPEKPYPKLCGVGINFGVESAQFETDYGSISLKELSKKEVKRQDVVVAIMKTWSRMRPALRDPEALAYFAPVWEQNSFLTGRTVEITGVDDDPSKCIVTQVQRMPFGDTFTIDTNGAKREIRADDATVIRTI